MKQALNSGLPEVHLRIGELIVTSEPQWVITLLGSCVSVTMFCHRTKLAGICHALLPGPCNSGVLVDSADRFRFISHVIPAMLDCFQQKGIRKEEIEVKMFGGANVLQSGCNGSENQWIGNANIIAAREVLRETGLIIKAESVGGTFGRKILFNTQTGEVLHKYLRQTDERIS